MRNPWTVALLVAVIGSAMAPAADCAESGGLDFAVASDRRAYRVGEPISVSFTWTNVGDADMLIPSWRGPTYGVTSAGQGADQLFDFAVYYEGKAPVPYTGGFACGIIGELSLKSKATLSESYRIDEVYSFARPGRYVLRSAYFGYQPDEGSPAHWRGVIVHPDVEIRVHE